MIFSSVSKHKFILRLSSFLLALAFLVSSITAIWASSFLMLAQAVSFSVLTIIFFILDYSLRKWETFPEYFNENGINRFSSLVDVIAGSSVLIYAATFIYSLFYRLPEAYKTDLLPVTLTAFLLSGIALYSMNFVFRNSASVFPPLLELIILWYRKLFNVSFMLVILHAVLAFMNFNGMDKFHFIINIVAVVLSFLIIGFDSLDRLKSSVKILLNDDVTEEKRFQILSFIAENIEYFCEFKKFRIKKINSYYLVDLYVVLPRDYTIRQINLLEDLLNSKPFISNGEYKIKLRSAPCELDCAQNGIINCPLKKINKNELL